MGEEDRKRKRAEHLAAVYKVLVQGHMYYTNLCI